MSDQQDLETFMNAIELISQNYADINPRKLATEVLAGYEYDPQGAASHAILPYLDLLERISAGHGDAVALAQTTIRG
jgi:glucose-6-phosphate isomerase